MSLNYKKPTAFSLNQLKKINIKRIHEFEFYVWKEYLLFFFISVSPSSFYEIKTSSIDAIAPKTVFKPYVHNSVVYYYLCNRLANPEEKTNYIQNAIRKIR